MKLNFQQKKKFIRRYGIDIYELCPCGSGKKYKWCCKEEQIKCKSKNELKKIYHNLKKEVWNRKKWKMQGCCWNGCEIETQRCHSIQNNRFLNQICDIDKKVYHFIPMRNIENEMIQLKDESISLASTFNGFCNTHDRELFAIIEGKNELIFTIEQKYALVYRNLYYMLSKKQIAQQIVIRTLMRTMAKYYQKEFVPTSSEVAQTAVDLILDLRKNQISYQELKDITLDIESNYDAVNHVWKIDENSLQIGSVRKLKVKMPDFCFQTVSEYLDKDEVDELYQESAIYDFEDKRYNQISTIILPDTLKGEIIVFFAISTRSRTLSPSRFLKITNECSDQKLIEILNNIIINSYEELYLSKSKYLNSFTQKEQETIQDLFTKQMFETDTEILLDDILSKSKFEFIRAI